MVIADLVHRDFENEIRQFGDVVNTRRPGTFQIRRKATGTRWPRTRTSSAPTPHQLSIQGPMFDLPTTLSKFLNLGMSLPDVIEQATALPARAVRRPELASLKPGSPADVAVFALEEGAYTFHDVFMTARAGKVRLVNRTTPAGRQADGTAAGATAGALGRHSRGAAGGRRPRTRAGGRIPRRACSTCPEPVYGCYVRGPCRRSRTSDRTGRRKRPPGKRKMTRAGIRRASALRWARIRPTSSRLQGSPLFCGFMSSRIRPCTSSTLVRMISRCVQRCRLTSALNVPPIPRRWPGVLRGRLAWLRRLLRTRRAARCDEWGDDAVACMGQLILTSAKRAPPQIAQFAIAQSRNSQPTLPLHCPAVKPDT